MTNEERIFISKDKENVTIESALKFDMQDIANVLRALVPLTKGTKYRQYTKKGPGRYHQSKSRRQILDQIHSRSSKEQ